MSLSVPVQIYFVVVAQKTKYIFLFFLPACLLGCASNKMTVSEQKLYSVQNLESVNGSTYLRLAGFDYKEKSKNIPAIFQVNGIIFGAKSGMTEKTLKVLPGSYQVKAGFVGYHWTEAQLTIVKGDSVNVQLYLTYDINLHQN